MTLLLAFIGFLSPSANAIDRHYEELIYSLVNINSGSENLAGCQKVRDRIRSEAERLELEFREFEVPNGHKVVKIERSKAKPKILFVGHVDTVFPESSDFQEVTKISEGVKGPGIIDMKDGIALMLNVIEKLTPEERTHIRIILNDDEETGSLHSNAKFRELAEGIPYGLVFEPGLAKGEFINSHSGLFWFKLKVTGKAAHAGANHKDGINACVELSRMVGEISKFTNYSRKLTVNAGLITGGTKTNVVCENAEATFDIRYVERSDLDRLKTKVQSIASKPQTNGARAEMIPLFEIPSMPPSSSTKIEAIARKAAKKVHQKFTATHTGGGSDANQLAPTGMQLFVSLGPWGGGMHTSDEFMKPQAYDERLEFTLALVRDLLKE